MTPKRARKIAQECADHWYGGAAGLNLKEAIFGGIIVACKEERHDVLMEAAEMLERAKQPAALGVALMASKLTPSAETPAPAPSAPHPPKDEPSQP